MGNTIHIWQPTQTAGCSQPVRHTVPNTQRLMLKSKVFVKCDPSTWDLGRIWGSSATHSHGLTCLHYVQGFYFWGVGIGCSLPLCQCSYIILQPCAFNVKACIGARLWLAQRSQQACRLVPQTEFIYSIFWFNQPCVASHDSLQKIVFII